MVMGSGTPVDTDALLAAVSTFESRLGQVVHEIRYRNSQVGSFETVPTTPREARITVAPGITQPGGYFDIQWWVNGDYKYHYREQGLEFRFGREADNAETDQPIRHFHPPRDLDQHRSSCIDVSQQPELVSIAVGTTWYVAGKDNDPSRLNDQNNLP